MLAHSLPSLFRFLPSAPFSGYTNRRNLWEPRSHKRLREKALRIPFPAYKYLLSTHCLLGSRCSAPCWGLPLWGWGKGMGEVGEGDGRGGQSAVCRRLPAFVNQVVLEQGILSLLVLWWSSSQTFRPQSIKDLHFSDFLRKKNLQPPALWH